MTEFSTNRKTKIGQIERRGHRPDYWLPLLAVALLGIGLVVVYAISPGVSKISGVSEAYYVSKQFLAIAMGIGAFIIMSKIPYKLWRNYTKFLIICSIVVALAVQFLGSKVNGAYRWIQIGGISFQAAELMKFTVLVWAADLMAKAKQSGKLDNWQTTLKPLAICLGLIAIVVGVFESDMGSTAVMVGIIGAIVFVAGMPMKRLLSILAVILIGVTLLVSAMPYRRQRLMTFLNPTANCQSTGYQSCQALIAVGSGGMFGLGLGHSVQAYGYLPEAANDSIFAILAEKFGFIGMTMILMIYALFFSRIARIIERAPDDFSSFIVTGILAWFSVQATINIGAMIGLLPLKGITLPFISYGGTSLLFVTGALGLVFNISRYSNFIVNKPGDTSNEDSTSGRGQRRSYYTSTVRSTRN